MTKFWELLEESVIIQGTLALATTGAVIYLSVIGRAVPQELAMGWLATIGFFFGSKGEVQAKKIVREMRQ